MTMREVQVDGCFFKIAMPEQHLDGAQVGTVFEHVSRKAMTKGVRMDALVLKARAFPAAF